MSASHGDNPALQRLEELLAAHGAEPGRWPPERRETAERLVATDAAAARLLAEARALDGLLARASQPAPAQVARLAERIAAAAALEAPSGLAATGPATTARASGAAAGNVVALRPPARDKPAAGGADGGWIGRRAATGGARQAAAAAAAVAGLWRRTGGGMWPAGGLLAASLVLGLLIGGFAMPPGALSAFDLAEKDSAAEVVSAVQADALVALLEEDQP